MSFAHRDIISPVIDPPHKSMTAGTPRDHHDTKMKATTIHPRNNHDHPVPITLAFIDSHQESSLKDAAKLLVGVRVVVLCLLINYT